MYGWYGMVNKMRGGCRFMAACAREEEKASANRQRKTFEVAPGVTLGRLRRFRAAMIGPTLALPKPRRLRR